MSLSAQHWLQKIHELNVERRVKIMNVCGGHERAITMAGLRSALPANIELIPGPGCPVCICPEEDIYHAIQLAQQEDIIQIGTTFVAETNGMERTFAIVGSTEADPLQGKISNESPLGQAFLGHAANDTIEVEVPSGKMTYRIVSIK